LQFWLFNKQVIEQHTPGGNVFEFFDENARRITRRANQESDSLNHAHIGTEHLVLSLFGDNTHFKLLADTSYRKVRTSIEAVIGVGLQSTHGHRPFTPAMNATMRRSVDAMIENHHFPLTPLHLFVGMLQNEDGIVHSLLDHANINRRVFYKRLDYMLESTPTVWSSFHTRLPAVVHLYQRSYTQEEIIQIHKTWQLISSI
jgi:ATP-dependent Clp protease ATP-binding subunit ClpA